MRAFYGTFLEFYTENPDRRWSEEADYGGYWRLEPWEGRWRVSYVRKTGEVYAVNHGVGPVIVLGWVQPDPVADERKELYYRTLEKVLEGWGEARRGGWSLKWVAERLDQYAAASAAGHNPQQAGGK